MVRLMPHRRVTAMFLWFPFVWPPVRLQLVYRTYAVDELTVFLRSLGLLKDLCDAALNSSFV